MEAKKGVSIVRKINLISCFTFTLLYLFSVISESFAIRIFASISILSGIYLISNTYIDKGVTGNRYTIEVIIVLLALIACEFYLY